MSLTTALNAAISGLQVSARGTQVIADNVANAGTAGYAVRVMTQAPVVLGGKGAGVAMTAVQRQSDPALVAALRDSNGAAASAAPVASFWQDMRSALAQQGAPDALAARLTAFDTALSQAAGRPDSLAALVLTAQTAQDLTRAFHQGQAQIDLARDRADKNLEDDVRSLNTLLSGVADLNRDIQKQLLTSGEANALLDQRQSLIDQIAEFLPVKEVQREFGRSMLLAQDGTILVDREPAQFDFQRRPNPLPGERVELGDLSPVMLGQRALGPNDKLLQGGRLAGLLEVRDVHAPSMQSVLDDIATDLVARFASPIADPTYQPGQFGLFRDPGSATPAAMGPGLAGRISVAPEIRPDNPNALWRLRDGLAATQPGPVGARLGLAGMQAQLNDLRAIGSLGGVARSSFGQMADLATFVATQELRAQSETSMRQVRRDILSDQLAAQGVDTDAQMQKLLLLEKHYSANAKIISTADAMLRTLLEI